MDRDERWRESVRAALREPPEPGAAPDEVAVRAIHAGTLRLAERSRTRVAVLGLAVGAGLVAAAYGWARFETDRTAELLLLCGAPWTP